MAHLKPQHCAAGKQGAHAASPLELQLLSPCRGGVCVEPGGVHSQLLVITVGAGQNIRNHHLNALPCANTQAESRRELPSEGAGWVSRFDGLGSLPVCATQGLERWDRKARPNQFPLSP